MTLMPSERVGCTVRDETPDETPAGTSDDQSRRRTGVVVARQLARRCVQARDAAGMTQEEAARRLGWSVRKQQLLERGDQVISHRDLDKILPAFGVAEADRPPWRQLVAAARQRGWWDRYGDEDLTAGAKHFLGLEQGASRIRVFCPMVLHGLLQTEAYRRAILAASVMPRPPEQIDALAEVGLRRQEVLTGDDPLRLCAILDEAALHRHGPAAPVMRHQLVAMADRAERLDNVTVQVIPLTAGFHAGLGGPFDMFEFGWPGDPGLLYVELLADRPTYLEDRRSLYAYSGVFERLTHLALPPGDSVQMLRDIAGRMPA